MPQYGKNMSVLIPRFPSICQQVSGVADDGSVQAVETKQGDFVPVVVKDENRLFVHSRFDPVKEADRFIGEIPTIAHDLFIIFGFGFGYHIERLLASIGKDSLVLAVEKSPLMIRSALEKRDLSQVLSDERFILLLDPDEEALADALRGKSSRRSMLVMHRGSYQAEPGYYENLQHIVRSYLSTKEVNIATLAKFEKIWAANIARNINIFIKAPGVNIFFDAFRGVPAIIAAAGPSLPKSIDFIRRSRDRAIVIAVDTSFQILLKHGIEPHFCVVVDPQAVNARYFEGAKPGKTVLIADPTVHPSVFRLFSGRAAMTGVAFDLMRWIERLAGEKGVLTHGGSVSTNAYDFAKRIGASPVVLVGQDLAFTEGLAHARGSYLDEQVHLRTGRLYSAEMFNRFQLTALPKIFVKGIKSTSVQTNQKMMIFLSWFEKRLDDSLINGTYDGAFINGVRHIQAEDILLDERAEDIEGRIGELYRAAAENFENMDAADSLTKMIGLIQGEIDTLLPVLERAVGNSESLRSLLGERRQGAAGPQDGAKLNYLLAKLADADRFIESKKHAKDMISFSIQRVVHTVTEGYEIDEDDRDLTEDELVAKRSLYLYRGLLDGARFNSRILKKMSDILADCSGK